MAKSLEDKLRESLKVLPALVKERMQRVGVELEAYVDDHFQESSGTVAERGQAGRKRNTTDKLRVVRGTLRRAFVKGRKGYDSGYEHIGPGVHAWRVGIKIEDVPYWRIQEYGGTINHPGGTSYKIGPGGKAIFVKAGTKGIVGTTKPHDITIKARPYIKPALQEYQRDVLSDVASDIMQRLLG